MVLLFNFAYFCLINMSINGKKVEWYVEFYAE